MRTSDPRALSPAALRSGLLLLLLASTALPQDGPISLHANADFQTDARRFAVTGDSDLPDHTLLGLMVYFCGEAAPGAIARGEVRQGQFTLTCAPPERTILSGVYELEVRYSAFDQVPEVKSHLADRPDEKTVSVSLYVGTRDQEAQETRQYQDRLKDALSRINQLYGDLRTKAKDYLEKGKEFREAEFVAWMKEWRSKLTGLQDLVDTIGPARVFAPRFPESVRDLTVISSFLDLLFLHYFEQICRKNGLDPARAEALEQRPAFSLMVDEYIREIDRRMTEVAAREDEKREPTSFDLYRDLLDYQGLFSSLLEAFDRARRDADPAATWARRREPFVSAVAGFQARVARYKLSQIEKAHPEVEGGLAAELGALGKGLLDLDEAFGREVKAGAAPAGDHVLPVSMKQPVDGIRSRFQKLYDIVLKERARMVEEVQGRLGRLVKTSDELEAAREKVEKGETRKDAWAQWILGWRDRLRTERSGLEQWKKDTQATFHLPQSPRLLDTMGQCLDQLGGLYDDSLCGRTTEQTEERIKYNRDTRDYVEKQVRAEVEQAGKGR